MESFLSNIANRLCTEHSEDLSKVTVVFNNRRPSLFLRQELLKKSQTPFFLPTMMGMDSFIAEWASMEIVPNDLLLFYLFHIHTTIANTPCNDIPYESFESFMPLGEIMVSDFNEIDLYCADAEQLFDNLHDLKEIGEWDIETGNLTPFQERYLRFYKRLYQYYTNLNKQLSLRNQAYPGMAYRHVAENIDEVINQVGDRHFCFVGFNALSTSEEIIIRRLVSAGKASFYTDGDPYYFNNVQHEAGFFLRKHQSISPESYHNYNDHFSAENKKITVVNCPENILQCKYVGHTLEQEMANAPQNQMNDTAIILADESLLLPMLNSLPSEIKTANITMGFPLTNTNIHSLALKLISLHQRRRGQTFYHQDILDILSDQLICKLLGTSYLHSKLNNVMFQNHVIYSDLQTLNELCQKTGTDISPIIHLFCNNTPSPDDFLILLHQTIHLLYDSKALDSNLREKEAAACLLTIVDHLQQIQSEYHYIDNLNILKRIYIRLAQRNTVSFYGEPLSGVQILGVLEARNLDFKRIFLLSVNEGTMPTSRSFNSLIPHNLKTAFGLPTFHEKDAVYAYNFYRLLQRAQDIHILYSTESDIMGKGEPSRFIQQIRRELVNQFPDTLTLEEKVVSADNLTPSGKNKNDGTKSPSVLTRITEIINKGLSPSALNKYRGCPLKFYYENVLGIEEPDQMNDSLEQNELGSCIHAALESIYSTCLGHEVKPETLQQAIDNIDTILDQVLTDQFHNGRSLSGRNHFLKSVAKMQITDFLKSEIKYLNSVGNIEIIGLEQQLSQNIDITVGEEKHRVLITGIADRIDISNGTIRVIDYKSGKVDKKELQVADAEPDWAAVSDKWFQLMTYEWLFHHTHPGSQPHVSGIFPLRHLNSQLLTASWEGSDIITPQHLNTFDSMLRQLISELLNPDIPFSPNHDSILCTFCPFNEICNT